MYWPLQENVLTKEDKIDLSNFILENDRYTQYTKVKVSKILSVLGKSVNIRYMSILEAVPICCFFLLLKSYMNGI